MQTTGKKLITRARFDLFTHTPTAVFTIFAKFAIQLDILK